MLYSLFIWHLTALFLVYLVLYFLFTWHATSLVFIDILHKLTRERYLSFLPQNYHTLEIIIKVLITKVPSRKVVHFSSAIKFLLRMLNHIHESFQICLNFTTSSCMIEFYLELLINIVHRLI